MSVVGAAIVVASLLVASALYLAFYLRWEQRETNGSRYFMRTAPAEHRTLLRSLLVEPDADKAEKVRNLVLPSKSLEYARDRARGLVDRARSSLAELPESDARFALDTMAEFVVSRPM